MNKRAGAFCHPVGRLHNRSVVNDLRNDRGAEGLELKPCHRLDRFVSGLLVFAKGKEAAGRMGVQFEGRGVKKTYLALVTGRMADDSGRISIAMRYGAPRRVEVSARVRSSVRPTQQITSTSTAANTSVERYWPALASIR